MGILFSDSHNRPQRQLNLTSHFTAGETEAKRGWNHLLKVVQLVSNSLDFSQAGSHGSQTCPVHHRPVRPWGWLPMSGESHSRPPDVWKLDDLWMWSLSLPWYWCMAPSCNGSWRWPSRGSEPDFPWITLAGLLRNPKAYHLLWRRRRGALCISKLFYRIGICLL